MPEPPAARGQASAYGDFGEPSEPAQSRREKAAAEAKRKAEAEAEVKAQAEARRQAEADAKAEAKAQAEARRQAEVDARAEAKAQAEARRQAEADAKAEAKADAESRKQAEAEAKRRARAEARAEEEEEEGKGKSKMWVIAAIVAVLLGAFGVYYTLYLRKPVPKPAVAELTTAHPAESTSPTQTAKPKPGPATPAATATATPTTDTDTAQTAEQPTAASAGSDAMQKQIDAHSVIDRSGLKPGSDTSAPPPTSGIDMGTGNASAASNVFGSKPALNVAPAAPKTISVAASIMAGRAISKPAPAYPSFARTARVEGTVVLHATISKTGTIQNVSVVSGPQMLRQAAADAVKTWRYKPYLLDNEPVEVETNVDVIFVLSR
jgi:TonB family protein